MFATKNTRVHFSGSEAGTFDLGPRTGGPVDIARRLLAQRPHSESGSTGGSLSSSLSFSKRPTG